jgi:hypothetical protein
VTAEAERDEGDGRHGGATLTGAQRGELRAASLQILEAAWRTPTDGAGFCVPNPTTYPWQWLWDSCFHSVVWAHLDDERAIVELSSALSAQDGDGFVPHIGYHDGPFPHADFWGRPAASSITQPPMYGHAVAALTAAGMTVPGWLVDRATNGLRFLLERRRRSVGGLVELCHPWESGCDDSPRWDAVLDGAWSDRTWFSAKGDLLRTIDRSATGAALFNPGFAVGSVGFSALVAWNAWELAGVTGDDRLLVAADELAAAVDDRWDGDLRTWVDDGPTAASSGRVRTLDALLPLLVAPRPEAFAELRDPAAFAAPYGPRGVHAGEPTYDRTTYWRGPAWPQLSYLLWEAATSARELELAGSLASSTAAGALQSGFSEYWEPGSGSSLGAAPQSWTTLACRMLDA